MIWHISYKAACFHNETTPVKSTNDKKIWISVKRANKGGTNWTYLRESLMMQFQARIEDVLPTIPFDVSFMNDSYVSKFPGDRKLPLCL